MIKFVWWYQDDYHQVTLNEGESKEFREGGPHEEGYSYTTTVFGHEGDLIRMQVITNAQDCDGRLDSHYEYTCSLDRLEAVPSVTGAKCPDWVKVGSGQRDYSAEAMNY